MDRLDDAMLVCDTLAAHAPTYARDGHLAFRVAAHEGGAELRVGELSVQGARKLVQDADVPGVGNVLERVTSELTTELAPDGEGEDLVLALAFA